MFFIPCFNAGVQCFSTVAQRTPVKPDGIANAGTPKETKKPKDQSPKPQNPKQADLPAPQSLPPPSSPTTSEQQRAASGQTAASRQRERKRQTAAERKRQPESLFENPFFLVPRDPLPQPSPDSPHTPFRMKT